MDKSVLQKATLDNDEPCAAWMFKAIANMTKASPKASDDVVQWLVHRLNSSKSPRTKKKCLNIIRSVATSGDPEFARQIIRQSEEIKKNANFRGPMDPLHGDALNQAVRQATSDAIDAIFERTEQSSRAAMGGNMSTGGWGNNDHNRFAGIEGGNDSSSSGNYGGGNGSTSMGGSGGGIGSSTNSKYVGFGSQPYKPTGSQSENAGKKGYLSTVTGIASGLLATKKKSKPADGLMGHWEVEHEQNSFGGGYQSPAVEDSGRSRNMGGGFNSGGGGSHWDSSSEEEEESDHRSKNSNHGVGNGSSKKAKSTSKSSPSEKGDSSGYIEKKIVSDFTAYSKVKLQPTRQELTAFCGRCAGVNGQYIAKALNQKLNDDKWQVRLKALYALEGLVRAENETVIDYFNDNIDIIEDQTESTHEPLQVKARKVLNVLSGAGSEDYIEEDVTTLKKQSRDRKKHVIDFEPTEMDFGISTKGGNQSTKTPKSANRSVNLLDPFDDDDVNSQSTSVSASNETNDLGNMFESMDIKSTPATKQKQIAKKSPVPTTSSVSSQNSLDDFFGTSTFSVTHQVSSLFPDNTTTIPVNTNTRPAPMNNHGFNNHNNHRAPLKINPNLSDFVSTPEPKKEEKDAFEFVKQAMK